MLKNATCIGLKMAVDVQAVLQRVPFRNKYDNFKMKKRKISQLGTILNTNFLNRFYSKNNKI